MSRLPQISSCISAETGKLDFAYLKQRISRLPQIERIVVLIMMNFIQRNELSIAMDNSLALPQVDMLQKLYGKYKDVVCLIPINKLDTALLRKWFFK